MDLLRTLGRIYQDADQSTSDLINNNIQFAQGQQEDRSIRQDRIEERRKHRRLNLELDAIQRANDLAREVEELQRKVRSLEHRCEVTRDLATDVILDRSSIMSAMKAVIANWNDPARVEQFLASFDTERQDEKARIEQDNERQNAAYHRVDEVVNSWSLPNSTRRRRPPGLKKK
ncbi:hypothetical protein I5U11_14490 [Stenotrophomonas maltophilia]|uniref:hypothetical protein n=1 Tax=Stenotrophomonas TaxID=40323 RepID=UPI0013101998|nr:MULTISPECIES: hypothetical protein [Stenotrophomonas]MBB1135706.1 hypothetical protein [Stenotrophomonas sp. I18B00994]MBH1559720.1 hypothetical protein [Stenotrophomonas maltophilia]